jgi:hypothetical protein
VATPLSRKFKLPPNCVDVTPKKSGTTYAIIGLPSRQKP